MKIILNLSNRFLLIYGFLKEVKCNRIIIQGDINEKTNYFTPNESNIRKSSQ